MFVFGYWIHVGYAIIITCMVCSLITASIVGSHEKRTPDRGVEEKWIDSEYLSDFAPT
jgi:hypothetical protein